MLIFLILMQGPIIELKNPMFEICIRFTSDQYGHILYDLHGFQHWSTDGEDMGSFFDRDKKTWVNAVITSPNGGYYMYWKKGKRSGIHELGPGGNEIVRSIPDKTYFFIRLNNSYLMSRQPWAAGSNLLDIVDKNLENLEMDFYMPEVVDRSFKRIWAAELGNKIIVVNQVEPIARVFEYGKLVGEIKLPIEDFKKYKEGFPEYERKGKGHWPEYLMTFNRITCFGRYGDGFIVSYELRDGAHSKIIALDEKFSKIGSAYSEAWGLNKVVISGTDGKFLYAYDQDLVAIRILFE